MDRFKVTLLSISDQLSEDNVVKLKFLCSGRIGKKKLEQISTGIHLFECLIERAEIGPGNTELLRDLLTQIGQKVLLDLLDRYEGEPIPTCSPNPEEQEKINQATELIVQNLGRKWLQYGRRLGLSEVKLEGIQEKHPRNLDEQVRELFKEWSTMRKADASVNELITALRACSLNLTADVVEKKLNPNLSKS